MSNRSGRTATVRKSNGAILEARTASPAPVPLVLPRAGAPAATVSREVNVVDRYVDFRYPQALNPPPVEPPANVKAARPLVLLQRFAVQLNHNIVCHTSPGAGGLLGKKHASTVCGSITVQTAVGFTSPTAVCSEVEPHPFCRHITAYARFPHKEHAPTTR
jgi:hypothetical protein